MQAESPAARARFYVGVDPGYVRLGVAVVDWEERRVVEWGCLGLFGPNEYQRRQVAGRLHAALVADMHLDECRAVVMEEQFVMRHNQAMHKNRLMHLEGVLAGMFQQNGWMVPPRACKAVFDLCSGDYRQNKKLAIAFIQQWVHENFGADACPQFDELVEQHSPLAADMADAMLQVAYCLTRPEMTPPVHFKL